MRITIAVVALAFSAAASGQTVYKCQQPDGKMIYQSTRCMDGSRGRMMIQDNGVVSGEANQSGLRPGEQAVLNTAIKPAPSAEPVTTPQPAPPRSVTESRAWKGLDKIQQESTDTINALNRLLR